MSKKIDDYTQEELTEKFRNLPEEVKEVANSIETTNIIRSIARRHNLHVDKQGDLADEIQLTFMGLTKPNQFVTNLREKYGFTPDEARVITNEVNNEIFAKIRESLEALTAPKPPAPGGAVPFTERVSHPVSLGPTETTRKLNDPYREPIE